ncbi:aminotransferase class I/II-fold pyridoxal phosphate-dependent enzyme [Pimelobacter simplex]|uniref:aminotransferase class I/II-fold pyridoxal phosphate-dependent enzyme n=1 Tax=Nocardioides simplex TaxID=2045 RepID=UPI0013754EAC|nr:aminotransferase class I/II-fold pyridoxal phosphate-dependent enzyme [Pimelobacter simplex]
MVRHRARRRHARHLGAVTPADVVIAPGSQSALSSIFRALVAPGQPLLVESPTYWGAIQAARQAGVELVPVPVADDGAGPDPAEVDRLPRDRRAGLLRPAQLRQPDGRPWSVERADEILAVVRAHGAFLVDDDWAHDFGIDTTHAPSPRTTTPVTSSTCAR